MTNERLKACDKENWSLGHLLTMWGFLGLAAVGTATGIGTMIGILRTPLALLSPLKSWPTRAPWSFWPAASFFFAKELGIPRTTKNLALLNSTGSFC